MEPPKGKHWVLYSHTYVLLIEHLVDISPDIYHGAKYQDTMKNTSFSLSQTVRGVDFHCGHRTVKAAMKALRQLRSPR